MLRLYQVLLTDLVVSYLDQVGIVGGGWLGQDLDRSDFGQKYATSNTYLSILVSKPDLVS